MFIRSVLTYQVMRAPTIDIATRETWAQAQMYPPQMQIPLMMDDWVPRTPEGPLPESVHDELKEIPEGGGILIIHNLQVVNHRTNLGVFVILATPHGREGDAGNEEQSKERLKSAAGLLGAVMGRNGIYERLFSFEVDLQGHPVTAGGVVFENPAVFKTPDLSVPGLGLLELCSSRIRALQSNEKDRTGLSLRWLYEAMEEFDGVFSFLKYWIALETLAMPDSTNIKPVTQRLAAGYGIPEDEARSRFAVGRLFDLRGQIVHDGQTPTIGQDLLAYIEGVYVDVLAQQLDLRSAGFAQAALTGAGRTVAELTNAATPVARRRLRADVRRSRRGGVTTVGGESDAGADG